MNRTIQNHSILPSILDKIPLGIFVLDKALNVVFWNRFMETHSKCRSDEIIGKSILECFPDLPKNWLRRKIQSVLILKNFAFTTWEERPFLFNFHHHHPITGEADYMFQDCTFFPIKNDKNEVEYVLSAAGLV